ncbi:MAG: zf-HC2 domain-containing protein [Thermoleophilaceae bacterium]|nr:zf-HC2 domain-containing protein [Thermoleophilaceae bacterium]
MSCQELTELVTEYLEGTLPAGDHERFEQHLETCPRCQTYLEQMRQTIRMLGRLPAETISPEARGQLRAAFRGWTRPD